MFKDINTHMRLHSDCSHIRSCLFYKKMGCLIGADMLRSHDQLATTLFITLSLLSDNLTCGN